MRKIFGMVGWVWMSSVLICTYGSAEEVPAGAELSSAPAAPAVTAPAPEQPVVLAQAPAPGSTPAPITPKNGLAFGGNLFLALQNWSNIVPDMGQSGDSKIGFGLGGTFGIGFRLDSMKVVAGPALWSNTWSASATNTKTNVTSNVHLTMTDAGVSLMSFFDDMYLELGTGNSTVSAGARVGNQETSVTYDKQSFSYKTFSIGFKSDAWMFGLGIKNYDGTARIANHANFMVGLGF